MLASRDLLPLSVAPTQDNFYASLSGSKQVGWQGWSFAAQAYASLGKWIRGTSKLLLRILLGIGLASLVESRRNGHYRSGLVRSSKQVLANWQLGQKLGQIG